ncbi:MAG: alpha-glucan family phosphorylase, partial [Planctomycetota bacterium]
DLPVEAVLGDDGHPLEIEVQLPGRKFVLRAWKASVGRVPLYLLDADTPSNRPEDRDVTRNLYGGDHEMRLKQEIVLGRGGARLLDALGIQPAVWHINEGHAAFLTLERVARLVGRHGWTFEEARELVRRSTVFTTHTPVPAGHDRFGEEVMRRYFSDAPEWVGLPWERFMALGQAPTTPPEEADGEASGEFNMTYLAMHFAVRVNGVAKLHGVASRKLLHPYWPQLLEEEVPIRTITNGIHLSTWVAPELTKELGADSRTLEADDFVDATKKLKPARLWELRRAAKAELLTKLRGSLRKSFVDRGDSPRLLGAMLDGLEEDALYIGFARRFAPYKRAHLLFSDMERLLKLVGDTKRPLRFLVAGKAHPADERGKDILRGIAEKARTDELAGKVIFLEDYGMDLASSLVQGVDVWLNNPTRMLEASGTSGMKSAANGGLNLSIAD